MLCVVMKTKQKYYIGNYDKINIRCLACRRVQSVMAADLKFKQHVIKVSCPCSHSFVVNLEYRKSYRKQFNIAGSYRKIHESIEKEKSCTVINISTGGIGLTITNDNTIQIDDELIVYFRIGTLQQHKFKAICQVRQINSGINVGGMITRSKIDESLEMATLFLQ